MAKESAFEGTVLEGRERRYTILNERDMIKYLPADLKEELDDVLNNVLSHIEEGRIKDNKHPWNSYIIVNTDETYADEVFDLVKRRGGYPDA